jgi:uncharacterized protein
MTKVNPFKFGSIVEDPFFTNRVEEQESIKNILQSATHLIVISPRRYGKTSLVKKVVSSLNRPLIFIDLQLITDVNDLASQMLKKIYRHYPFTKLKNSLKKFRIVPSINLNPQTNDVEITFSPTTSSYIPILEDVFNLLENLGSEKKRPIVVFDEFQDIKKVEAMLDRQLRAIIQHHQHINYVFLGSVESMMREIFEKKKSPFYHFGQLMPLSKIPHKDFSAFISGGFESKSTEGHEIAERILDITQCHPYYTQQLTYTVWNNWNSGSEISVIIESAIGHLTQVHDLDYQRFWQNLNQTDKKILLIIAKGYKNMLAQSTLRQMGIASTSTLYSGLKRLTQQGYIIKENEKYELDDPFFKIWLLKKRNE